MSLFKSYLNKASAILITEELDTDNEAIDIIDDVVNNLEENELNIINTKDNVIMLDDGFQVQVNDRGSYTLSKNIGDKIDFIGDYDNVEDVIDNIKNVIQKNDVYESVIRAAGPDKQKALEIFKIMRQKQRIKNFNEAASILDSIKANDRIKTKIKNLYEGKAS